MLFLYPKIKEVVAMAKEEREALKAEFIAGD